MKHPIPSAALDDRLGFLGTSGSGKTYNAGTAVEILLSRKARVVIIDPLGVWWGLRLLADGKKASNFNVAIFGGPHGDLPLTEHAGALIGETAATMAESCIIDLSELKSKAAERRFMSAFLETIYRKAGGEPFHLVCDEVDLFAPQKPADGDQALLGHMENIVRRGRIKGFIPWLISQRPAVVNKNVLSQVDGLLAFKLTSTQDRDALDAWIEGQADKAQGKAIKDALPTLQIGQGIVWIPGRGVLEAPAPFPTKVTFDSSRTPKRGEKLKARSLKPLNLSTLKDRLATVEAEARSDNPKLLRADVAKLKLEKAALEKQVADAQAAKAAAPDKATIDEAEKRGFEKAKKKYGAATDRAFFKAVAGLTKEMSAQLARLQTDLKATFEDAVKKLEAPSEFLDFTPTAAPAALPRPASSVPPQSASPAKLAPPKAVPRQPAPAADGTLSGPQRLMLQSLRWWKAMGHDTPTRVQVATICGWRITSGHLKNIAGSLKTLGLIDYPSQGSIALTADGLDVAPEPDTGTTLIESVRAIMTGPQRQAFDAMPADGSPMSREDLANAVGWNVTSGHVKNVLGSMRSLEVIDYPTQGAVARADWLRAA